MKNEYNVTQKMYQSWAVESMLKPPRINFIFFWACLAIMLLIAFFMKKIDAYYLIFVAFFIYRAFFRTFVLARAEYHKIAQVFGKVDWLRSISFGEDGITVTDTNFNFHYLYTDFIQIRVKNNKIWLTAKNKSIVRMYKNYFIDGDWEQCEQLLKEKNRNLL